MPDKSGQGSAGRSRLLLSLAGGAAVPGVALSVTGLHVPPGIAAALYGVAIIGAAFLLSWAAEAIQVDISAGLAIGLLALVAVLPEYAVDFVFTMQGGADYAQHGPSCVAPDAPPGTQSSCGLALANMTGANRILVGVGWSMVVLLAAWRVHRNRTRERGDEDGRGGTGGDTDPGRGMRHPREAIIGLKRTDAVPLAFLALATAYSLFLPLRHTVTLVDSVVLVGIFVAYSIRVARAPAEDPDLIGPSAWIGGLDTKARRGLCTALFLVAAAVILLVAEHFADSLVQAGTDLGISQFFLVQWLAPLASETPELLVAGLYAWRLKTTDALATLVSSKVNQWTLLVGTLPVVFAFAAGGLHGLPIDAAQREELLLTAAQSLFAVALLVSLRISVRGALALLGLFLLQFVLTAALPTSLQGVELVSVAGLYLLLSVITLIRGREHVMRLLRDGFRTPYRDLADDDEPTRTSK